MDPARLAGQALGLLTEERVGERDGNTPHSRRSEIKTKLWVSAVGLLPKQRILVPGVTPAGMMPPRRCRTAGSHCPALACMARPWPLTIAA